MDFMFLSASEQTVLNFDARSEIISKDRFFDRAKKYITTDHKFAFSKYHELERKGYEVYLTRTL